VGESGLSQSLFTDGSPLLGLLSGLERKKPVCIHAMAIGVKHKENIKEGNAKCRYI
jgi:hypothetical protein